MTTYNCPWPVMCGYWWLHNWSKPVLTGYCYYVTSPTISCKRKPPQPPWPQQDNVTRHKEGGEMTRTGMGHCDAHPKWWVFKHTYILLLTTCKFCRDNTPFDNPTTYNTTCWKPQRQPTTTLQQPHLMTNHGIATEWADGVRTSAAIVLLLLITTNM